MLEVTLSRFVPVLLEFQGASSSAGVTIIEGVTGTLRSLASPNSPRNTCFVVVGSILASYTDGEHESSSDAEGDSSKLLLLKGLFDPSAVLSFSRLFDSTCRSFKSTNSPRISPVLEALYLFDFGTGCRVKLVTRLESTGLATFFPVTSGSFQFGRYWVARGIRLSRWAVCSSIFCLTSLGRNAKGRFCSLSAPGEDHDGLGTSSVIGDDRGNFGARAGTSSFGGGRSLERISRPSLWILKAHTIWCHQFVGPWEDMTWLHTIS